MSIASRILRSRRAYLVAAIAFMLCVSGAHDARADFSFVTERTAPRINGTSPSVAFQNRPVTFVGNEGSACAGVAEEAGLSPLQELWCVTTFVYEVDSAITDQPIIGQPGGDSWGCYSFPCIPSVDLTISLYTPTRLFTTEPVVGPQPTTYPPNNPALGPYDCSGRVSGNYATGPTFFPCMQGHYDPLADPLPDLVAGSVSPTTATVGQAVNLTGMVTNQGTVGTGAGFTNRIIISELPPPITSSVATLTSPMGALAAGASGQVSVVHTFPTAGTWYAQLCADVNGSQTGSVDEGGREGNNCGAWTAITVSSINASCSVAPTSAAVNATVTWTATATGGTAPYTYAWTGQNVSGGGASKPVSYTTPGIKTASVAVTDASGAVRTVSCSNSVTVGSNLPDLTASNITPTSATVGTPVTFRATVANGGASTAVAPFPNLFQIDLGGSYAYRYRDVVSNLAANAVATIEASQSYPFTAPGTYKVRACADSGSGWASSIVEGDESNNCSGGSTSATWTTVTVCPTGQTWNGSACVGGSTLACAVSKANPALGETVTYTATGGAAPYAWSFTGGTGTASTGSTASRTYSVAGPYTATVTSGGNPRTCPVVTAGTVCSNPSVSIEATPTRVRPNPNGTPFTLSWTASGVSSGSCTITGTDGYTNTIPVNACAIPGGSSTDRTITTQTTYTIACGGATDSVTVNVLPDFTEF